MPVYKNTIGYILRNFTEDNWCCKIYCPVTKKDYLHGFESLSQARRTLKLYRADFEQVA